MKIPFSLVADKSVTWRSALGLSDAERTVFHELRRHVNTEAMCGPFDPRCYLENYEDLEGWHGRKVEWMKELLAEHPQVAFE